MLPKNRNRRDRLSSLIKDLPRALIEAREAMDREQQAADQVVGALSDGKAKLSGLFVNVLYQELNRQNMHTLFVPMTAKDGSIAIDSSAKQISIVQIYCLFRDVRVTPFAQMGIIRIDCCGQTIHCFPVIPGPVISPDMAPAIRAQILSGDSRVHVILS